MKTCFLLLVFVMSYTCFSQNNYIVKIEDGRRVLLKSDYTWEYIDNVKSPFTDSIGVVSLKPTKRCDVTEGFAEPRLNKKIQAQLKKGRATINYVKKKVAKDHNCNVADVLLLSVSERKEKAVYRFCANGLKVTYKRLGNSIVKGVKFF